MTKLQIAHKLRLLQDNLNEIAGAMYCYEPPYKKHGRELANAANLVAEWADEIEAECIDERTN